MSAIPDGFEPAATCGACWGPVCRPARVGPGQAPELRCVACRAVPRPLYGPVLPMMPKESEGR